MARRTQTTPFQMGDLLRFRFGGHLVRGTVLEDRGPVGAGGRRLLRVSLNLDSSEEPLEFELPAADVESAASVEGPDPDRDEAWSAELDRRDDEFDSGGVIGVPAAEVHASARARLRSRSSKP